MSCNGHGSPHGVGVDPLQLCLQDRRVETALTTAGTAIRTATPTPKQDSTRPRHHRPRHGSMSTRGTRGTRTTGRRVHGRDGLHDGGRRAVFGLRLPVHVDECGVGHVLKRPYRVHRRGDDPASVGQRHRVGGVTATQRHEPGGGLDGRGAVTPPASPAATAAPAGDTGGSLVGSPRTGLYRDLLDGHLVSTGSPRVDDGGHGSHTPHHVAILHRQHIRYAIVHGIVRNVVFDIFYLPARQTEQ